MHCSIPTWPTSSNNPASFIPVIIDYYPFDWDKQKTTFENQQPERCPGCRYIIDSQCTWEGEKVKCVNCSKIFKPNNSILAQEQSQHKRFLFRQPITYNYKQILIFAIDPYCSEKEMSYIQSFITVAIEALPPTQQFLICILRKQYNVYVYVFDNNVVTFDIPHNILLSKHLNIRRDLANRNNLKILEPFIRSLQAETTRSRGIDDLIGQLRGDDTCFSRIILFGNQGQLSKEEKNICVDWISPSMVSNTSSINIDGYFLDTSLYAYDSDTSHEQIRKLIEKATSEDQYYNVTIKAEVTNYRCSKTYFQYASCASHFYQTFLLSPHKFLCSILPSTFAVEVKYEHFKGDQAFTEIQWCSHSYPKSENFIPVASGVDAYQLMPYLISNQMLGTFVKNLYEAYQQNVSIFPGDEPDTTFSIFPNLQLFLCVHYDGRQNICSSPYQSRSFLSYHSRSASFYPNLMLWNDQETLVATRCIINYYFYVQMHSPPIIVFDESRAISVFIDDEIIPGSKLDHAIKHEEADRFPKPVIMIRPTSQIPMIFSEYSELFKKIQTALKKA
ncbi:hypothetical protein TVAG_135990 [Trichomonas vaginalis G3]|uniref:Protein transport protein SEC23 n=1 Tax=Trichomonas vaginalis (strain ATCC PRA-98 / G3) TaxID=412133 RepID=A2DJ81_TRIV3|nr:hypothetical protein TVAGG3_0544140 [Trichomonas vaginalis G3]EAY19468.1 hypothetical protein TVAG_135990 [Trichomonas vaginalis G3]KAI5520053.1 hypothetical protein TVAGG3_0544140 [Trichomonas vaginalis G3]|eukprot:XP_001580454.1 hypothetical protein [Trichomonas vaginalis G3]